MRRTRWLEFAGEPLHMHPRDVERLTVDEFDEALAALDHYKREANKKP